MELLSDAVMIGILRVNVNYVILIAEDSISFTIRVCYFIYVEKFYLEFPPGCLMLAMKMVMSVKVVIPFFFFSPAQTLSSSL